MDPIIKSTLDSYIETCDYISLDTVVLLMTNKDFTLDRLISVFEANEAGPSTHDFIHHEVTPFEVRAYLRRKQCVNVRRGLITDDLKRWFDTVQRISGSITNRKAFELAVLFKLFPKYSMDYNIPHMLSDLASYTSLKEFLEFMHEVDSCRLTTINSKLLQIFEMQYIDQVIAHLMGDEDCNYYVNLNEVRAYKDSLVAFLKLTKAKRKPTHVREMVRLSHSMDRSIVNTVLLVLFKSIEKPGLKTNFFLKCILL
ncbi:p34 late protein [Helicoverpa zea nudivirus 2]|uniref:p34 late protein n=1 Tax=Helicoverpa zea nudivirus 2 TaxID=1128424 RepID=G9I085_HZNV2|nr:orf59 gene product [Helicoverpa zea nudivirus 2]AEW69608.1 p34 late protein [Helicoverpa zea nudivirus 2]